MGAKGKRQKFRWDDKNSPLLGTMTDSSLAKKLEVPVHLVLGARLREGIPSFRARLPRAKYLYKTAAQKMSDESLLKNHDPHSSSALRDAISDERKRRGLEKKRKEPFRHGPYQVRSIMVEAALKLSPRPTLQEIGEILGLTRERIRQIILGVK